MEERARKEKKERSHVSLFHRRSACFTERQLSQHGQLETAAATQAGLLFSFGGTAASLSTIHPAISISFLSYSLGQSLLRLRSWGERKAEDGRSLPGLS